MRKKRRERGFFLIILTDFNRIVTSVKETDFLFLKNHVVVVQQDIVKRSFYFFVSRFLGTILFFFFFLSY